MAADEKLLAIKFPENDTEYVDSEPYLRNLMDDVEKRVEKLREQAIAMEQEKETILATLQKIQDNDLNLELSEGINTIFIILSISYIAISIKKKQPTDMPSVLVQRILQLFLLEDCCAIQYWQS